MYESPINLIQKELRIAHDNGILKAISETGIDVDKDELIKALRYDREQYQKGYEDGKRNSHQWIPVSERLPEVVDYVLITFEEINGMNRVDKAICCSHGWQTETRYINFDKVLAWMPLPEPYKESEEE